MTDILLILFTITLFYVSIANRLMTYVSVLTVQGFLICGIAILSLHEMNVVNLVTILLETLVVKALAMPIYIKKVILKNNIRTVGLKFTMQMRICSDKEKSLWQNYGLPTHLTMFSERPKSSIACRTTAAPIIRSRWHATQGRASSLR